MAKKKSIFRNTGKLLSLIFGDVPPTLWRDVQLYHGRAFKLAGYIVLPLVLLAGGLNLAELKWANHILNIACNFALMYFASRPNLVAGLSLTGALARKAAKPEEALVNGAITTLELYWNRVVLTAALYLTILLWSLAVVSITNNPGAILGIFSTLTLLLWADLKWGFVTRIGKYVVYGCGLVYLVVCFSSFVPAHRWEQAVGSDPFASFRFAERDQALAAAADQENEARDAADAKEIRGIMERRRLGQSTPQDTARLNQLRVKRDEDTVLKRAMKILGSQTAATSPLTSKPAAVPPLPPATYAPPPARVSEVRLPNPLCREADPTSIGKTISFNGRPLEAEFTLKDGEKFRISGVKAGTQMLFEEREGDLELMVMSGLPDWTQADKVRVNSWTVNRDGSAYIRAVNGPAKFKLRVENFT